MEKSYIPFDWKNLDDRSLWLNPCEESYYYAEKWIVAPEEADTKNDPRFTREEILKEIDFQERFFDGELYI